jgi:predicted nucleotidyltransferase
MRLTPKQQQIILTTLRRYFGQNSRILLFGSRVDDDARGGDIDLYIEPELTDADQLVDARLNAMAELHTLLGEQKIDLVINRHHSTSLPIYRVAQETGVAL